MTAWVDDLAVERALKRQPVGRRLTDAERVEVARELLRRGKGASEVARVLRCNGTTAAELVRQAS